MRRIYDVGTTGVTESCAGQGRIYVFVNPDESDRRLLLDEFQVDEHTLNSALDPDELSRLEFEPDHAAMIFKRPKNLSMEGQLLFEVASTGVFLFKDKLAIVSAEDFDLFDGGKQHGKCQSLPDVVLRLLNRTIGHFRGHLKVINMCAEDIEEKVAGALQNRYLLSLFTLEKSLVYYLSAIHSNGLLIDKLRTSAPRLGFSPEAVEFLDDVAVENTQCMKQAEIYANILASLMDARASIVSNNLNVIMKTLTLITIGIMLPTFVVSAFSMNVTLPWHLREHPLAFYGILTLAAISVCLVLLLQRMKKW
jgi:magnesium transporter